MPRKHGGNLELNERQLKWVERYLSHGDARRAAREAGYSDKNGGKTVSMLKNNPKIKEILAKARDKVVDKLGYTYEVAMEEAKAAADFAMLTKNANAFCKATELRAKLSGLLIERVQVDTVNFKINIAGIGQPAQIEANPAIDVTGTLPPKDNTDATDA